MADFRKKLFGLAGALTMFSGMAFGQLCNGAGNNTLSLTLPVTALNIRAEGQTELLPALTLTCQATGAGTSTFNVLVQIPGVTVTSKVLSSSTGLTEANITGGGAGGTVTGPGTPTSPTFGTISSGNVITFTGLSITTTGAGPVTMTISDIRINASALPGGGAFPTAVTANSFVQGTRSQHPERHLVLASTLRSYSTRWQRRIPRSLLRLAPAILPRAQPTQSATV